MTGRLLQFGRFILVSLALAGSSPRRLAATPPALAIDTDFPSGSARVLEIDRERRRVSIEPAVHPGLGWECWWYFHITGIRPGETLELDVGKAPWATPTRAAFSTDNQHWQQTESGTRNNERIVYRQQLNAEEAWFAWGPPFTARHADALVRRAADQLPGSATFELCRSRGGRVVPAWRWVDDRPDANRFHIWVQARQHAWESGSSWVCRGLTEWLASADDRAVALRSRANFVVVPIMDIDNVEVGAGGKNQTPHDHNRDWSDQPHFPAVAAAQQSIRQLDDQGQFDLFIDLHNPDAGSQQPFFFISPRKMLSPQATRNLDRFLASAQLEMTGPLTYTGRTRESDSSYDPLWQAISKNWVSFHTRQHVVAVTLETAWNTPHSTTAGYQTLGRQLGLAIERYLRSNPREP